MSSYEARAGKCLLTGVGSLALHCIFIYLGAQAIANLAMTCKFLRKATKHYHGGVFEHAPNQFKSFSQMHQARPYLHVFRIGLYKNVGLTMSERTTLCKRLLTESFNLSHLREVDFDLRRLTLAAVVKLFEAAQKRPYLKKPRPAAFLLPIRRRKL